MPSIPGQNDIVDQKPDQIERAGARLIPLVYTSVPLRSE
jgi:hypothetical protein